MRVGSVVVAVSMVLIVGCGPTGQVGEPGAPSVPEATAGPVAAVAIAAIPAPQSFDVGAGPEWSTATAYSCLQACALLFGGASADWACSTSATQVNHFGWYSSFGSSENCGPTGTPLAEDFNPGGSYQVAGVSAYVNDWCFAGEGSINYCHTAVVVAPAPAPEPAPPPAGEEDEDADDDAGREPHHRPPPRHADHGRDRHQQADHGQRR
jgi:hypothetical protein